MKILSGNRQSNFAQSDNRGYLAKPLAADGRERIADQVDCPACKRGEFPWLFGRSGSRTAVLCGRNAVQLSHPGTGISLDELAQRLAGVGRVTRNEYLLRLEVEGYELTVFPDARAIISGTEDVAVARAVYAKYIGN